MKIWVDIYLPDVQKRLENPGAIGSEQELQTVQINSNAIKNKINSFVTETGGKIALELPYRFIFTMDDRLSDGIESFVKGYQESLKTQIAAGIGLSPKAAGLAMNYSIKTGDIEFSEETEEDPNKEQKPGEMPENGVPDKVKTKEPEVPPKPLTAEEEMAVREEFVERQAMMQMASVNPPQPQQAAPQQQAKPQPQQGQIPEQEKKSEDTSVTELDPAKAEVSPAQGRVAGLLSTIRMYVPEIMGMADKNPEAFKAAMKLVSGAMKLGKSILESNGDDEKLAKALIKIPVGTILHGKIKIIDPATGDAHWRGVKTNLMLGPDGNPISVKRNNEISQNNELGKDELLKDDLEDEIAQALKDEDPYIRWVAAQHPNASQEHLTTALKDKDWEVRQAAKETLSILKPENKERIKISTGNHKLRKLRDSINNEANKRDLEKLGFDFSKIKHLVSPSGKIKADDIHSFIESQPKMEYGVSHSKWTGDQKHSNHASKVMQLNTTPEIMSKLKEAGVQNTFLKLLNLSKLSGHPVKPNTIGWVRYTGTPKTGFHIDEIQSDFGQRLDKLASDQAKAHGKNPQEAISATNKEFNPEHLKTIRNILFGGNHASEVLRESFIQHQRDKGNYDTPVSIFDSEPKAQISGLDPNKDLPVHMKEGYRELPKKAGFTPSQYGQLKTQTNKNFKGAPTHSEKVRKEEDDQDKTPVSAPAQYDTTIPEVRAALKDQANRSQQTQMQPVDRAARLASSYRKAAKKLKEFNSEFARLAQDGQVKPEHMELYANKIKDLRNYLNYLRGEKEELKSDIAHGIGRPVSNLPKNEGGADLP